MLDSFLNMLAGMGVEWRLLLMQAANFAIVAAILYYFIFRPVLKMMDVRKKKIEDGLAYADAMQKKLTEAEEKEAEVLNAARRTAQEIVEKARAAATAFEEAQSKETAARVEQMLAKAKEAIEMERRRQYEELKGEISRLVVLTTGKLLSRDLSAEERKSLNTRAAEELARSN